MICVDNNTYHRLINIEDTMEDIKRINVREIDVNNLLKAERSRERDAHLSSVITQDKWEVYI